MKLKKSNDPKDILVPVKYRAIPQPWRTTLEAALVILIIMPLFGKATISLNPACTVGVAAGNNPSVENIRTGKWGKLTLVPIVISPPLELVSTDWEEQGPPTWYFPDADEDKAVQMLRSAGVSPVDAARLRAEARAEPRIDGVALTPDPDWVRSLMPEMRARIYAMLAKCKLNPRQVQPFMYPGTSPEAWFGRSLISLATRRLVEPLIYQEGDYMMFSDLDLVRKEIGSGDELRRLSKALFRQRTMIAYLTVDPSENLDALVEYWGRGGRQTKIRALMESIAIGNCNQFVDVVHLLPPFVQARLYNYPTFSEADLNRTGIINCLWTSLNFFQSNPDDRFLDPLVASKTLKEDYFIVSSDFKLGDIVTFLDEKGNIFHAAVYIASDIMFTKNGVSSMAPWSFMSIDDINAYYRTFSENPRILVHRRKDL